ncbi:hypothetical protein PIROE2DRAFT_12798 [Piromyces sp. E2]|nr:hypothetical protein PIROE2DRAFT_12798 [Piromyces sp. E2]|eukprot:OUM61257.1 hypothetical protein PIROE2DRAFT_12798 [Piromyces sp. E2]
MADHINKAAVCTSFFGISDHKPILFSCNKSFSDDFNISDKASKWSTHICNTKRSSILSHNYFSVLAEVCLNRVKSEETLMEARSGSDVQIDRQIWDNRNSIKFYEVKRTIRGLRTETVLTYSQTLNIAGIHAHLDTTKGVDSSRQQDGGHGSRNPLRSDVNPNETASSADLGGSSKHSNENFED